MSAEMTPDAAAALRKPFPADQVGVLPQPLSRGAQKGRCDECGGWHGLPAVHLDYVGHAGVTDRLLAVDPCWTWEPMATTHDGLPATDTYGNLWIRLTILGVTRIGVGDGKNAKECIGDAIRNAAMRFGVALDLWAKEPLEGAGDDEPYRATNDLATRGATASPQAIDDARQSALDAFAAATDVDTMRDLYRSLSIANAPQDVKDAFRERVAVLQGGPEPAGGASDE